MKAPVKTFQKIRPGSWGWLLGCLVLFLFCSQRNYLAAGGNYNRNRVQKKSSKKAVSKKTRSHSTKRTTLKRVVRVEKKTASTVFAPFLGPKYARVIVRDRILSGAVFYLVSGHGGPDPGAIGRYGKSALAEDEYAYDVTVRLARALLEHGATTYMIVRDPNDGIRDGSVLKLDYDEVTYPNQPIPLNQTRRLKQGTDAINKLHRKYGSAYQRMVTVHVDSRSEGQNIDVFFYHHENSKVGKRLARHIHKSFKSGYKRRQPARNYLGTVSDRSSLYVVKNSHAPTVFIELGNIRNARDQQRFLLADNRQALANWICAGLQTDYRAH